MSKISASLKKELLLIAVSLVIGLVFTIIFCSKIYSDTIVSGISQQVIRLHVLANSNVDADQTLKLYVRDQVLEQMHASIGNSTDINETRNYIVENIDTIQQWAEDAIWEKGYDYSVTASLAKDMFPTKQYGDATFPAGEYEALRIEIGEAKGNNWWCVVFPPLCYVDVTKKEIPTEEKKQLKSILTEDEYEILLNESSEKVTPKIKFKIVELWQKNKTSYSLLRNKEAK